MPRNSAAALIVVFSLGLNLFVPPSYADGAAGVSYEDFQKFKDALRRENETGHRETSDVADPTESAASNLLEYVWEERKVQLILGGLVIGETLIATMLWKRMRTNVATWERQVGTVKDVSRRLAPHARNYALAEYDLTRALRRLEQADRAEVLKTTERMSSRPKLLLERALSTQTTALPSHAAPGTSRMRGLGKAVGKFCGKFFGSVHAPRAPAPLPTGETAPEERVVAERPALSVEEATVGLEKAYAQWQEAAEREAHVLKGAGRTGLVSPAPLKEISEQTDATIRAVTRLEYTAGQFYAFREEGTNALARSARTNLGYGLKWKQKFWRKSRTSLLLLAIPLAVLGISYADDQMKESERREQDLNSSSLQDRDKWLNTFVPYFHRPLLFTVVRSWNKVSQRPRSLVKIPCPYELKEAEVDNPDLSIIQSLAMQTLLEMENEGTEALTANGQKSIRISPVFYKKLFRKILEAEQSPLLKLEPAALDEVLDELANEAYHGFDQIDFMPPSSTNAPDSPTPPLGFEPQE